MDSRGMQEAVEIELRQQDKDYELVNKLESREIFYYLSRYQRDYIQEIYDSGVDKTEENRKKLGGLLGTAIITGASIIDNSVFYPNSYIISLPVDILYPLNERADMTNGSNVFTNISVKPITFDEYNSNKDNPFRQPNIDKCLRLEGVSGHVIVTDESVVDNIYLDYIKTPLEINLTQDSELHESVHYNLVNGAVKLILGAKEDQIGYNTRSIEEERNK